MSSSNRTRKGFTLVELLVTITILAILASVTVVGYTNFIKRTAIEVDESLVKQLNIFTDAYLVKHYSNLPDDNRIIADVLDESGVKPLTLQSREYGYDLWFKCSEKTFELKENFGGNGDYIHVLSCTNITPPTSTTTTNHSSTTSSSTNTPAEDTVTPEDTTYPKLKLMNFGDKPDNYNKINYAYSDDNCIHIGIQINGDNEIKSTKLKTNNIEIYEVLSNGEFRYWDIQSIFYQNEKIDDIENGQIVITTPGTQEIMLTLINPNTGEEFTHTIIMYVRNTYFDDAKIEELDKLVFTLTASAINDSMLNVTISITGTYQHLKIYDYNPEISRSLSSSLNDETTRLLPNMQIEIVINDESKIISGNDILEYPIKKTFNGLIGNPNEITCVVIYRYFGYNGITVEEKVPVNFKE